MISVFGLKPNGRGSKQRYILEALGASKNITIDFQLVELGMVGDESRNYKVGAYI
jgi:hypothetical protein